MPSCQPQERELTVGTVQREIHKGMYSSDILSVLGSPNIVTKDGDGETWVYDKFSSDVSISGSSGGFSIFGGGVGNNVGGVGGTGYSSTAGAASKTQRTLTVILNLKNGKLTDYDYHTSHLLKYGSYHWPVYSYLVVRQRSPTLRFSCLRWRFESLQTREFNEKSTLNGMKAVLAALLQTMGLVLVKPIMKWV